MKKLVFSLFVLMLSFSAFGATVTGDPTELQVKVFRFAVSASTDCSNPITVVDRGSNADYVNFLDSPNLGSGSLADGTYPCVMIEMSDQIKFKPATNVGVDCVANTEYTLDVCGNNETVTLFDGSSGTCAGDNGANSSGSFTETTVTLYLSTASTSSGGSANAFTPPTSGSDASNGFNLGTALTVSGAQSGTFTVNGTGKVESDDTTSQGYCEFQPPSFTFN